MTDHYFKNLNKPAGILFLLPFITTLVFIPAFFYDFEYKRDDQWMLLEQPFVVDFSWYGLKFHFQNV